MDQLSQLMKEVIFNENSHPEIDLREERVDQST